MSREESQVAQHNSSLRSKIAYFVGAIVITLLGLGINTMLKNYTETGAQAAREARANERTKAHAELRQVSAQELSSAAVLDKSKGIYRIPVNAAMELTMKEYQRDAAAARAGFVKRVEDWAKPPSFE